MFEPETKQLAGMVTAIIRWKSKSSLLLRRRQKGLTVNFSVGLLVGHSIAIVTTSLRLGHRARRRQLSWDDLLAFLSLVMVLVILLLYVLLPVNGHSIGRLIPSCRGSFTDAEATVFKKRCKFLIRRFRAGLQ